MNGHRLFKEHKSYIKEEEQQKVKLDKFIADNAEEWDIKNAVRASRLRAHAFPLAVITYSHNVSLSLVTGQMHRDDC